MDDYSPYDQWSTFYDPQAQAVADYDLAGWNLEPLTDAKMTADVTAAKTEAVKNGNVKFANTLDFLLKYGDKALGVLTKNGILKNQNLVTAGYTNFGMNGAGVWYGQTQTPVANAPTTNTGFNIDFSDPKTLIIIFLIVLILFYFFFWYSPKPAKSKR